jgi:antitoxin component YwqK of YwqJK toxin-antitoxin module
MDAAEVRPAERPAVRAGGKKALETGGSIGEDWSMKIAKTSLSKSGILTEYFADGSVGARGKTIAGKKTGAWKYYFLNGKVRAAGKFAGGKMIGPWKWYRESGELWQTGSFDDQQRQTGVWKRYHRNGKLEDEKTFAAGKKIGKSRKPPAGVLSKTTTSPKKAAGRKKPKS